MPGTLPKPPFETPIIDPRTGGLTEDWTKWLFLLWYELQGIEEHETLDGFIWDPRIAELATKVEDTEVQAAVPEKHSHRLDPVFEEPTRVLGAVYHNDSGGTRQCQISFQVLPDEDDMMAGICVKDNTNATVISGIGVANKVQFLFFDTNCPSNNATPDHTNDHITITVAGSYFIAVSLHAEKESGATAKLGFEVWKNNGGTAIAYIHAHQRFASGAGIVQAVPIMGLATLAVNDTIELWIYNDTNTNDITIEDCTLSLFKVGS